MKLFIIFLYFVTDIIFEISGQRVSTTVSSCYTDNIEFIVVKGPTVYDYDVIQYSDGLSIRNLSYFNPYRETFFFLHGWGGTYLSDPVLMLSTALLQRGTTNSIFVNYPGLVKTGYTFEYMCSVYNISQIGTAVGEFLQQFTTHVQNVNYLHLVGHSLGALAISKAAQTYGRGQIPWLTGLDPAGPFYDYLPIDFSLSYMDGKYVDVIHTDIIIEGTRFSRATADFYPNGGYNQPKCWGSLSVGCNHLSCLSYYAESITRPQNFRAKQCARNLFCAIWIGFCECTGYIINNMGYGVDKSKTGDYFLTTNAAPPYGN